MDKLLNYQEPHVEKLVRALNNYNVAVDASDTGTGKTYCALAIAKRLNLRPFIVCPKCVITSWKRVAAHLEIEPLMVINYDQLLSSSITSLKKQENLYKTLNETKIKNEVDQKVKKLNKPFLDYCKKKFTINNDIEKFNGYEWTLPNNTLIIFDEVHRCKNTKTLHFKLLLSVREYLNENIKCLMLSATIADKIKYFIPIGYTLGWYDDITRYKQWLKNKSITTGFPISKTIHHALFPFYGSRLRISELGNLFPRNQILPECYDMENANEIEEQYNIIKLAMDNLRDKRDEVECILAKIIRARQMIEILKYPTFCELIDDHLENNLSVVVFVNFTDTMMKIAKAYHTTSIIHGKQTEIERMKVIDDFQLNKTNIVIANIKAGGVGISLHDIYGGHPRVSIISPTWSAQDTIQTLGRIHRAEGKTPVIQKFVYCAGTIEEYICDKLREKLDNVSLINDGILHPFPKLDIDNDKKASELLDI